MPVAVDIDAVRRNLRQAVTESGAPRLLAATQRRFVGIDA